MTSTIDTITEEKLKKAATEAETHLEQLEAALPFLIALTSEQRLHSAGKLKSGEDAAIDAVITTVSKHPAPFTALKLDPKALRELLTRRALLQPLAARVQRLADGLDDTVLYLGGALRNKASSAYRIAAALAPHDQALSSDVQPAQQFYQTMGRAAARTRRSHTTPTPAAPSKP